MRWSSAVSCGLEYSTATGPRRRRERPRDTSEPSNTIVALARGVVVHHVDLVPVARIQSARTSAGLFQRRAGLATLHVDVAGGATPLLWDLEHEVADGLRRSLPRVTPAASQPRSIGNRSAASPTPRSDQTSCWFRPAALTSTVTQPAGTSGGSISATRHGAQPSVPTRDEVEAFRAARA